MKYLTKSILAVLTAVALFTTACTNLSVTPAQTQVAISFAIQTGLPVAVKDKAKLTQIANYAYVYAHALRTITGTPTPAELSAHLEAFIPVDVRKKYPELSTYLLPLIVEQYQKAYERNKNSVAKTYAFLNSIAYGIENGVAKYVTKQ